MKFVRRPLGIRVPKQFNVNEFYSKKEQNFIQSRKAIQMHLIKDDFNTSYNKLLQDKTNDILNKRM